MVPIILFLDAKNNPVIINQPADLVFACKKVRGLPRLDFEILFRNPISLIEGLYFKNIKTFCFDHNSRGPLTSNHLGEPIVTPF